MSAAFDQFVLAHDAAFAGFSDWLVGAEGRVDLWERSTSRFGAKLLVEASEAMAIDPNRPKAYSDHLPELIHRAQSLASFRDSRPLNRWTCDLCAGTGLVEVYPRDDRRFATAGGVPLGTQEAFCVRCPCDRGYRFAQSHRLFARDLMETHAERRAKTLPSGQRLATWLDSKHVDPARVRAVLASLLKGPSA